MGSHMSRVALALLVCMATPVTAFAQIPPVRTQGSTEEMVNWICYPRAESVAESNRPEFIRACRDEVTPQVESLKEEMKRTEQSMADAYAEVRSRFVPRKTTPQISTLLEAQREWIKFREWHCAFVVEWAVGKYENRLLYLQCALGEAKKREAYFRSLL